MASAFGQSIVSSTARMMIRFHQALENRLQKDLDDLDRLPVAQRPANFVSKRAKLVNDIAFNRRERQKLEQGDLHELQRLQRQSPFN